MKILKIIYIVVFLSLNLFADTVCVLYSGKNKFSEAIAKNVKDDLEKKGFNIIDCAYNNKAEYDALSRKINSILPDYLLSLGKSSTKLAASMNISGVFAMAMNTYSLELFDTELTPLKRMTGILMNVKPAFQLDLIQRVMALPNGIGFIYNPANSQFLSDAYTKECSKRNIPFNPVKCEDPKDLVKKYNDQKGKSDCFISILDPSVYTMNNIFNLLQFVARNKIPFVGVSSRMVEKGALIATFPDAKNIHMQIIRMFDQLKDGVPVKNIKVEYPSKVDFCLNKKMERTYNVSFSDDIIQEALLVVD